MSYVITLLAYATGGLLLLYFGVGLAQSAFALTLFLLLYLFLGPPSLSLLILFIVVALIMILLAQDSLRLKWITAPFLNWYRKALPTVSETEQVAIDAGTVWWEGEIFRGKPHWEKLLDGEDIRLTEEEQAFLDGPVMELCRMVNAWEINFHLADIPEEIVNYIKDKRFLGIIIPREYGGLELSAVAQVAVMTRIFSVGSVVGNFISVPNSLGPGELLVKYGTDEQKQHYLPRLARGEELPCFALTAPLAGSDATSIPDTGIVCRGQWQGEEIVGMRLNINKRYITLAPVATLIGLAFKLRDPEHLLGEKEDYGITCALIPRETEGLEIGRRHYPIGDPFLNGPIRGKDIFVPLEYIIGGIDMAGQGWRMLIECLSTGRAISLPTISNSIAKNALASTSAYTRIRRQFGLPIANFEGVQKPLARMGGFSYIINAATVQTARAIATGAKPAVPASILKYHCTEMARTVINDGMDIQAGKAVMKGPGNMLHAAYESVPVAITVEGANIMTRSLMIFGQGAIRCHPYVLKEMELAQSTDTQSMGEFDRVLRAHIGNTLSNTAHSLVDAFSWSFFNHGGGVGRSAHYYRYVSRLSAAFAVVADVAMLTLQGSLKKREMLSARLGDLLSNLYLTSMVLKQYHDDGKPKELEPVVDWCCQYLLHQYQKSMLEFLDNLPNRIAAWKLNLIVFPLGGHFSLPSDKLDSQIADLLTHDGTARDSLIKGTYLEPEPTNPVGRLNSLLASADELDPLLTKLRKASRGGELPDLIGRELIEAAAEQGFIDAAETEALRNLDDQIMDVINVDDFEYDAFSRTLK